MLTLKKYKTIIVDDEPPARMRLKKLILDYQELFEITGEAENGDDAIDLIDLLKPDLVFLDIQMPETDGFEVLKKITHNPIVVFCTAFDQYALKAFDSCCADYMVKPVTDQRFRQMVEKINHFNFNNENTDIQSLISKLNLEKKKEEITAIPVNLGDRIIFIRIDDITYFEAKEKYVIVFTKQSKSYTLNQSLKKMEEMLPEYFIRVHKSIVINKTLLKEVNRYFNNRFVLIIDDYSQTRITTGRNYFSIIKNLIEL